LLSNRLTTTTAWLGARAVATVSATVAGQVRFADETDRSAFRAWFAYLADAQYYRPTRDVTDCAALVRHAVREALKPHTPEWHRLSGLPVTAPFPDVRTRPEGRPDGWPLFRTDATRYAEFADARTIVALNARSLGRDAGVARPGDLLYFRQEAQVSPDHLMVFVGQSRFEPNERDWIVYHTGPLEGGPGEVRKVRLADLVRHPSAHWRPVAANPAFAGIFRLSWL
jgi:uncharacterized protein YfaT (DUF1175 family)